MGLYKRGKIWWLSFVLNGRQISKSTKQTDRRLADNWAASYRAEVQNGRLNPFLPPREIFLSEVLARYLRTHVRVNRPASYERCCYIAKHLRTFFWKTPVSRVRARMDEYKAWRKGEVETSTINREVAILKAALSKAVEYGLISDTPMRGYRLERENNQRVRFIEDSEFYRLLNAAHPDLAPILIMARYTGMRQGEIIGLQWYDVDLKRGFAHLRQTKSGESRMVPLSTQVVEMLSKTPLSELESYIFRHKSLDPIRAVRIPHDGTAALKRHGWLM
jgi:integrase